MATNVVPKGAGRGSANAKRTKAAQRTPLPPKSPTNTERSAVRIGREMAEENRAKKTARQRKAAVAEAILAKRAEPPTQKKRGRRDLDADVAEFGAKVVELRGKGTIWLHIGRACLGDAPNANTVSIWAQRMYKMATNGGPDNKPSGTSTRTPKSERPKSANLPWEAEEMEDDAICAYLGGKSVSWKNTLSGNVEEAVVTPAKPIIERKKKENSSQFEDVHTGRWTPGPKLELNPEGRDVLTFVSRETGFRSCYLDAVLSVG